MENIKLGWYEFMELTPEEIKEAIAEGKRKKYFREQNRSYWEGQEAKAIEAENADKVRKRNRRLMKDIDTGT